MLYIEVRLTKCRLYLTEKEINSLLALNPVLWEQAIKRGKGITRAGRTAQRKQDLKAGGFR